MNELLAILLTMLVIALYVVVFFFIPKSIELVSQKFGENSLVYNLYIGAFCAPIMLFMLFAPFAMA